MQKFLVTTCLFFMGLLLFTLDAPAQSVLKEFGRQRAIQWRIDRTEAESLAILKNMPIRVDRSDGRTMELQRFENGLPIYFITNNINAAKSLSTDKVWSTGGAGFSLTGNGILLGEWDGGAARATHQEFGGRVLSTQGSLHYHSTHVAGTMIAAGVAANAKGMSSQATLKSFDWNSDESEVVTEAAAGLRVSNHSYGTITGWDYSTFGDGLWVWFGDVNVSTSEAYQFGYYNMDSYNWDLIARNAPYYLMVKSAGNDRGDGPSGTTSHWVVVNGSWVKQTVFRNRDGGSTGYDCIAEAGLSKNVLTVGAVNDVTNGYTNPAGVTMSSFSSWGPTDDGRIKPDIVANGINLYSTFETADNAYGTLSGTSMATPNATGSIGLLLELQKNLHGSTPLRSSTLKAIIINTADETGPNPGPDYMFGWGLMNTLHAAQLMKLDSVEGVNSHIREILLNQEDTVRMDFACDGTIPLKATICWTDPPGIPAPTSLNPTNIMLKNDLDIRIIRKRDKQNFSPWVLTRTSPAAAATTGDNIRDNVEQVYLDTPEKTLYTLQISHKSTLSGGSQYVSLAVSGNVKTLGPAFYAQKNAAEYSMIPDSVLHDSVKIRNHGDSLLTVRVTVPTENASWLEADEDSVALESLDSTYIHFTVDPGMLNTWMTYTGAVNFLHNDTTQASSKLDITLNTLGSTIVTHPAHFAVDVDNHEITHDTLIVRNDGHIPLLFSISDTGKALPLWLTADPETGSINPGESLKVVLAFNEADVPIGNYSCDIYTESNDNQTGTVTGSVEFHLGTTRFVSTGVTDFWNIISTPVQTIDNLKTTLYPTAISDAFSYTGIYAAQDNLNFGTGYWMKFASSQLVTMEGYVLDKDTIPVNAGWNLIGSLSNEIPAASVTSEPAGIINSFFFTYNRGYNFADALQPGKGYWIQTNQAGNLFLNGTFPPIAKQSVSQMLASYNSITFTDAGKNAQTLYFGSGAQDTKEQNFFKLPPSAPVGSFDVRFASGRMLELIPDNGNQAEYPIQIRMVQSPITVRWDIKQDAVRLLSLKDENGKLYPLSKDGSVTLEGSAEEIMVLKLTNEAPKLPTEYALNQNYPNPFNPSTVVNYQLPIANFVTVKVYNNLGQEVATLVNGYKEAGSYSVDFDASNLPSGTYIYKMTADKFTSVKKMVLMR